MRHQSLNDVLRRISASMSAALLILLASGCSDSSTPTAKVDTEASSEQQLQDECRGRLNSAVSRFSPVPYSTQARPELVVNSVNSWLASCAEAEVKSRSISEANAAMLSENTLRTASAVRFTENDVVYLRDCLMLRDLSAAVWSATDGVDSSTAEQERVIELFRHIVRTIALVPASETDIPTGLYEPLLIGLGSVDDRIWAFGEALRQRQIDCFLLETADPGDGSTSPVTASSRLICVVSGNTTLLFDPALGTPVPTADDSSAIISNPASISVLQGQARWENAALQIIAHPSSFAPRMLVMQERLEAADAAVLYEELAGGTSEIRPLLERLGDAIPAPWSVKTLSIWPVPEQRTVAAAAISEQQQQQYDAMLRPLQSPFERESLDVRKLLTDPSIDETRMTAEELNMLRNEALAELLQRSDALYGTPSRRLLRARVSQISGNFELGMIQELQQIRIASMQEEVELTFSQDGQNRLIRIPLPAKILDVQRSALGDSLYWTAMAQISRNDASTAVQTLRNYRRQYPEEKMVAAAVVTEAELLISMGNNQLAANLLAGMDRENAAEKNRIAWLLSRLPEPADGTAAAESAPPAEATEESN